MDVELMSPKELLATYNDLAAKNGLPTVARFATRLVGVTRVTRLLDKAKVDAGEALPQPRTRAEIPSEWPLVAAAAPLKAPELEVREFDDKLMAWVSSPPISTAVAGRVDDSNPHAAISEVLNGTPDEVFVVTEVEIAPGVTVLEPDIAPVRDPFGDKEEKIVQLGTITEARLKTVKEIIDTLRVIPKPLKKPKPEPAQRVKGSSTAGGVTFASRTYDLLREGKTDAEIWAILEPEFKANNAYECFPKWYRAHLAHAETRK